MSESKVRLKTDSFAIDSLKDVEAIIKRKLASEAPLLSEVSNYLHQLGGKRIRPLLTIMVAKLLGLEEPFGASAGGQRLLDVAAGIELIHMATLLHDDIIDKSPLRRHEESAFKKYGIEATLLAGDFLLVRAFGLCARLDRFIIDATEAACIALTEGEILEVPLNLKKHTLATSLEISRKKTAALFKLACLSASHIAGAGIKTTELMGRFGESLGIAFQILDDILDVCAAEDLLGKKTGQDLRERKPSIVNLLWLESESKLAKKILLSSEVLQEEDIMQALKELQDSASLTKARELARDYIDTALKNLDEAVSMAESNTHNGQKEHLAGLCAYVLQRLS